MGGCENPSIPIEQIETNDVQTPIVSMEYKRNGEIKSITINEKTYGENDFGIGSVLKCLGAPNILYTKNSDPSFTLDEDGILTQHGITNKKFDISNQLNMSDLKDALENNMFGKKEKKEVNIKDKLDSILQKIDNVDVKTNFFENEEYKEDFIFLYDHFSEMTSENIVDLLEILLDYAKDQGYDLDLSEVLKNGIKAEEFNGKKCLIIGDEKLTANISYKGK